ncbi:RNA-binding protein 43 [Oryzias latipes]|uniref:RRM domain-containing protein n=1 Tax=Oryzias latipes TaxID=8090 RepID=A0A3B3HYU3_ORYLA|nr:RNA-binding protein 43 [Oryzias latipes]
MAGAQQWLDGRRTVVVSGVPAPLPPSRMADKLTIHFQSRRRSAGGDVEGVTYPTDMDGVAFVTFDRAEDAAKVVEKEQQVMEDEEFPAVYTLTVFPFSTDVFLYVNSATVDLSVFDDPASLIARLKSTYRSIRFQRLPQQSKVSIEGPFYAVRALREDLTARANSLKPLAQSASINSNVNIPNFSSKLQVPDETLGAVGEVVEQLTAHRRLEMSTNCRTDGLPSSRREVVGAETMTRTASFFAEQEMSVKPKKLTNAPSAGTKGHSKVPSSPVPSERGRSPMRDPKGAGGRRSDDVDDIWVDEYTFKYIKNFHKEHLDRCLTGLDVWEEHVEGNGLVRIRLRDKESSRKDAAKDLQTLITSEHANLRVYEISLDQTQLRSKRQLTKFCEDAAFLYQNVLYLLEESSIKVIGPASPSFLFRLFLEDKIQMTFLDI